MATTMKGLLKGLRYITQIFDEEKQQEMQIGFPTDVKHVAHIGNDGPVTNMPSWMKSFKPQEHEKGQVVSRGNSNKYNPQGINQGGAGLKELLPPSNSDKPKQKTRRKPGGPSPNGSPPVQDTDHIPDGSAPPRKATSRPRKLKGSMGGEASSMKKPSKGKPENSVDTCNDI